MRYVVNSGQMKACDHGIIHHYGVPSLVLMERAALCVVSEVENRITGKGAILVVCGSGNNGGDGLVVARLFHLKGYPVSVCFVGKEESATEETKVQLAIVKQYGIPVTDRIFDTDFDVVIDSIFGIGLSRNIQGSYFDVIRQMNEMSGLKVAVDIPSGINGDTGHVMGIAFKADLTVTFAFAKTGHLLYPGASFTGELFIGEMGIDEHGFLEDRPSLYTLDETDLLQIPSRPADSNKGTFGKVLVIAGAVNMAGAACFSAKAAYRTGAGLVRVLTREENRLILQSLVPEAVLTTYGEADTDLRVVRDCIDWADVIVIGPGLGQSVKAKELVKAVLEYASVPCIVDADAVNILACEKCDLTQYNCELILTPHIGEMSRLIKAEIGQIKEDPLTIAGSYARKNDCILVLKDARTITALPTGESYINCSGNSGMATGGSGDVLTGIIAGLYCQGCTVAQSAYTGVYLHGLAGDYMAEQLGEHSLMASDMILGISMILKEGKI